MKTIATICSVYCFHTREKLFRGQFIQYKQINTKTDEQTVTLLHFCSGLLNHQKSSQTLLSSKDVRDL